MDLYVSLEALEAYAESTARTLPVTGSVSPRRVCGELNRSLRALRSRERRLAAPGELTEAERAVSDLMGDKVEPRRDFIQSHARDVRFLDI